MSEHYNNSDYHNCYYYEDNSGDFHRMNDHTSQVGRFNSTYSTKIANLLVIIHGIILIVKMTRGKEGIIATHDI